MQTRFEIDIEEVEYEYEYICHSGKGPLLNILCLQSQLDVMHPRQFPDEFIASYRKAGGDVQLKQCERIANDLIRRQPDSEAAKTQVRKVDFIHEHAASNPMAA